MREKLGPEASDQAKAIWPHFLEAKGEGFRLLWEYLAAEGPKVCETAYTEVRQWRAQSFGWLEPKDFLIYITQLRSIESNALPGCIRRKERLEAGDYPPPELDEDEPRFGPPDKFPELIRTLSQTAPGLVEPAVRAASPKEQESLLHDDELQSLFSESQTQTGVDAGATDGGRSGPRAQAAIPESEPTDGGAGYRAKGGKQVTAERLALIITASSIKILEKRDVWQPFGYRKVPSRSRLRRKILRLFAENKIEREIFLFREILAISISRLSQALARGVETERLAARSVELLFEHEGMAATFAFDSQPASTQYLGRAIHQYLSAWPDGIPTRLTARAEHRFEDLKALDERWKKWFVGSFRLASFEGTPDRAISELSYGIAFPVKGDVKLEDPSLADLIRDS